LQKELDPNIEVLVYSSKLLSFTTHRRLSKKNVLTHSNPKAIFTLELRQRAQNLQRLPFNFSGQQNL